MKSKGTQWPQLQQPRSGLHREGHWLPQAGSCTVPSRRLTGRSTGHATAWHPGRAAALVIIGRTARAPRRRVPVNFALGVPGKGRVGTYVSLRNRSLGKPRPRFGLQLGIGRADEGRARCPPDDGHRISLRHRRPRRSPWVPSGLGFNSFAPARIAKGTGIHKPGRTVPSRRLTNRSTGRATACGQGRPAPLSIMRRTALAARRVAPVNSALGVPGKGRIGTHVSPRNRPFGTPRSRFGLQLGIGRADEGHARCPPDDGHRASLAPASSATGRHKLPHGYHTNQVNRTRHGMAPWPCARLCLSSAARPRRHAASRRLTLR
jgi:hypothetical protein